MTRLPSNGCIESAPLRPSRCPPLFHRRASDTALTFMESDGETMEVLQIGEENPGERELWSPRPCICRPLSSWAAEPNVTEMLFATHPSEHRFSARGTEEKSASPWQKVVEFEGKDSAAATSESTRLQQCGPIHQRIKLNPRRTWFWRPPRLTCPDVLDRQGGLDGKCLDVVTQDQGAE